MMTLWHVNDMLMHDILAKKTCSVMQKVVHLSLHPPTTHIQLVQTSFNKTKTQNLI
jgi:hypothetical protein